MRDSLRFLSWFGANSTCSRALHQRTETVQSMVEAGHVDVMKHDRNEWGRPHPFPLQRNTLLRRTGANVYMV